MLNSFVAGWRWFCCFSSWAEVRLNARPMMHDMLYSPNVDRSTMIEEMLRFSAFLLEGKTRSSIVEMFFFSFYQRIFMLVQVNYLLKLSREYENWKSIEWSARNRVNDNEMNNKSRLIEQYRDRSMDSDWDFDPTNDMNTKCEKTRKIHVKRFAFESVENENCLYFYENSCCHH